jgi:G3E family GTPase
MSTSIPVSILTGFLGSGKTTLLNRLVRAPGLKDTAIIVNELGEVGLDHLLVAEGDETVVLLDSGCLCCTIANSLPETLADLSFRRACGEVPAFVRVIVETTGLANPAPIVQALMNPPSGSPYRLGGMIATLDALHGAAQLDSHPEALRQAAMAERIVITKSDLAGRRATGALRGRLAHLNPAATIFEAVRGVIEPLKLLDVPAPGSAEAWAAAGAEDAAGGHGHSHHAQEITTFAVAIEKPVTWSGYAAWTAALRAFPGEDLLRIKGLLNVAGQKRPAVIHGVQHVFSPPENLPAWPDGDRRSRLVFIVRNIDETALRQTLDLLHAEEGTMPVAAPRPTPPRRIGNAA